MKKIAALAIMVLAIVAFGQRNQGVHAENTGGTETEQQSTRPINSEYRQCFNLEKWFKKFDRKVKEENYKHRRTVTDIQFIDPKEEPSEAWLKLYGSELIKGSAIDDPDELKRSAEQFKQIGCKQIKSENAVLNIVDFTSNKLVLTLDPSSIDFGFSDDDEVEEARTEQEKENKEPTVNDPKEEEEASEEASDRTLEEAIAEGFGDLATEVVKEMWKHPEFRKHLREQMEEGLKNIRLMVEKLDEHTLKISLQHLVGGDEHGSYLVKTTEILEYGKELPDKFPTVSPSLVRLKERVETLTQE